MRILKLTGLKAQVPIGFMAALGVLRHAAQIAEFGTVKLAWAPHSGGWCAVLHTTGTVDEAEVPGLLLRRIKTLVDRPEFAWAKAVKSASKEDYVKEAGKAIASATPDDHQMADWFAAFGTELVLKKDSDVIDPTPLDMTVAKQLFLEDAEWLTQSLRTPDKKAGDSKNEKSLKEALFGLWRYQDDQHSLGWDPSTLLMGAFTPKAPTAMSKAGNRGVVWLAMESLPYFPCFYDGGLATRAFEEGRKLRFMWPVWTSPLSAMEIRLLLSQVPNMKADESKSRGIAAVYASEIFKPNKYLTSFQAGVLQG